VPIFYVGVSNCQFPFEAGLAMKKIPGKGFKFEAMHGDKILFEWTIAHS